MRFTPAEHAEVARLFRLKLASLRAEERRPPRKPRRRTGRIRRVPEVPTSDDALLSTGEVAALLGVSPRTVASWGVRCVYTLGGHRRYKVGHARRAPQRGPRTTCAPEVALGHAS